MDPVSGLKGELFRPLTTVLVPGVVAVAPFAAMAFKRFPQLEPILSSTLGMGALILFLGVLFGMLMEDVGSQIESNLWRWFSKNDERDADWATYLQLKTKDEIIGQRYLKTIHMRLKFELSLIPALVMFGIGANWYNHCYGNVAEEHMRWASIAVALLVIYLAYESNTSIVLLADTRKHVIAGCRGSTPNDVVQHNPSGSALGMSPTSTAACEPSDAHRAAV
jgi:hypothetical protein